MLLSFAIAAATTKTLFTVAKVMVVAGTCMKMIGPLLDEKPQETEDEKDEEDVR
ncbi:MAG TPA: hypothetical protein IAC64_00595 [Candidatus Caccomorpha excrementavium]|nr:hypothetical protein [Candidatus Caccomorpha excrementavium]